MRDRFDVSLDLCPVPWTDLRGAARGERSAAVRERVVRARHRQATRQGCLNAQLDGRRLQHVAEPADKKAEAMLEQGVAQLRLSARAVTRVLRVARTVADLEDQSSAVTQRHVAEALQYRVSDRMAIA